MKIRLYMIPLFILLFISLTSCTQTNKRDNIRTITLLLDAQSAAYAPILAGKEQGYFQDHGINLEVHYNADKKEQLEALANESVDLIASSQPEVIIYRSNNLPFVSVFALLRRPLTASSETDFPTNYYGKVLVANETKVKSDILLYRDFANALTKGYFWVKNNPEAALDTLFKQAEKDISAAELDRMLALMAEEGTLFGSQSLALWEQMVVEMKEKNVIKQSMDPHAAFVDLRD